MDAPCRPTRPRTCPPCSARTRRPSTRSTNSPRDSRARSAATPRGVDAHRHHARDRRSAPGRRVRRHPRREPARRGVRRSRRREGRRRGRDGCRRAPTSPRPAGFRSSSSTTPAGCSATCRRGCTAPAATTTSRSCSAPTGTNGKTSVSHLLEGILGQLGVTTGLSSTAERHIAGQVIVSRLTTPEAYEMHALLALMRERGVEAVAVEVSAQALSRRRVDGIVFDVAGFTNLTHDHLDDYADMREYFEAKLPLFRPDRARRAVVSPRLGAAARGRRAQRGADRHRGHARDRRRSGCRGRGRLGRRDPRRAPDRHRVPPDRARRPLADHRRAGHRPAHGRERRASRSS